jgi:hypothetical protein
MILVNNAMHKVQISVKVVFLDILFNKLIKILIVLLAIN